MHPLRRVIPVVASVGLVILIGALGFVFTSGAAHRAEQSHKQDRETLQTTLGGLGSQYQSFALKEELDFAGSGQWTLTPGDAGDRVRLQTFASHSTLLGYGAALADLSGRPLNNYSTDAPLPPPTDPGYLPMIEQLRSGQPGLSSVMRAGQTPVVAAAVPIIEAGTPKAIFVAYFRADTSALQTYVQQLRVAPTGRSFVVDSEGGIIAASDGRLVGTKLPASVLAAIAAGRSGFASFAQGSARGVVSYAPFRFGGWASLTTENAAEFYGPIRSGQLHIELAGLALLTIAATIIGVMGYKREAARRHFQEKLAYLASHDSLTDLPNRAMFQERLGAALARQRRGGGDLAVLYLDLDGFKEVNDGLGHDVGDELLVEVAGRLRQCVRGADMVARMGGDEFTVLLEDVPDPGVTAGVCGRILAVMDEPLDVAGHRLAVRASVGVAVSRNGDSAVEDLLRDADLAMYRAKDGGGSSCVLFDDLLSRRFGARRRTATATSATSPAPSRTSAGSAGSAASTASQPGE